MGSLLEPKGGGGGECERLHTWVLVLTSVPGIGGIQGPLAERYSRVGTPIAALP